MSAPASDSTFAGVDGLVGGGEGGVVGGVVSCLRGGGVIAVARVVKERGVSVTEALVVVVAAAVVMEFARAGCELAGCKLLCRVETTAVRLSTSTRKPSKSTSVCGGREGGIIID